MMVYVGNRAYDPSKWPWEIGESAFPIDSVLEAIENENELILVVENFPLFSCWSCVLSEYALQNMGSDPFQIIPTPKGPQNSLILSLNDS